MRLSYRPTFAHFTDNYLATHFSSGVQTLRRLAGGPILIVAGSLLIIAARTWMASLWLRLLSIGLGVLLIVIGAFVFAMPLINIFLVWLRRDQLFGDEQSVTTIELLAGHLKITERGETVKLPLAQIQSVQHRAASTWILTRSDTLIYVPRQNLLSGDHDQFIAALEEKIAPPETQE
ncbi:MAG: hypothetical protein DWG76_02370 [Chloroflexi bacterium]|nr:hypothetical protein [Chloroflexota bacterium]